MPHVSSNASATTTRLWVALDVHKSSITAGVLPPSGGEVEIFQLEHTEKAIRRLIRRLGGPKGLTVSYEAGPCGYALYRLLSSVGVACDIIAPSLTPVRPGDRVKTDTRDARRLVSLYRSGELSFVSPPGPEQEGLRDLVRCRDDLRRARASARHRISKQLLRHGFIYREGKRAWTKRHREWLSRQRLEEQLSREALAQMLLHLDSLDCQIASIDRRLEEIASAEPWQEQVARLCLFRGISTLSALSLLAEIGDFRRFATARELASFVGLTVSEYSSGDKRSRGRITKTGNAHVRRLLVEAAWHYRYPPRISRRIREQGSTCSPELISRAWQAQIRLQARHSYLIRHGKSPNIACVAVARELSGFIWAQLTDQPLREGVAA